MTSLSVIGNLIIVQLGSITVVANSWNNSGNLFLDLILLCFEGWRCRWVDVNCRRGSPLVIGVKSNTKLATDRLPVLYSKGQFLFVD